MKNLTARLAELRTPAPDGALIALPPGIMRDRASTERIGVASLLLAAVCKLAVTPSPEAHADACRRVSALHQDLHAPATLKAAFAL